MICDDCNNSFEELKNAKSVNKKLCKSCYQKFRNKSSLMSKLKNPEHYKKLREMYVKSGRRRTKNAQKVSERKSRNVCTECGTKEPCSKSQKCLECYTKHKESSVKHARKKYGNDSISRFELYVFNFLEFKFKGLFRRSVHNVVKNPETNKSLTFDIYSDLYKIAIEIDGKIHRENCYGEDRLLYQKYIDNIKNVQYVNSGISLIRINTDYIDNNKIKSMEILSEAVERIISKQNVQRLTGEIVQIDKPDTNIRQPLLAEDIVRPWWKHQEVKDKEL